MKIKNTILKYITSTIFIFLLSFSFVPSYSNAQVDKALDYSGWVQCDGAIDSSNPTENLRDKKCDFVNLIASVTYLIKWVFGISVSIAIGLIAYAGILYMTGEKAKIEKAKKMLWNVVVGFIVMLMAWFIVTTILKYVLNSAYDSTINTVIKQ